MFATLKKELLILLRDPSGLLMLLIMPLALIIVTSIVQDAPYRDYQEMKFDILIANNDNGSVGKKIVEDLRSNKNFVLHFEDTLGDADLRNLLKQGKAQMGIIIPKTATSSVVNMSNKLGNAMAEQMGLSGSLKCNESADTSTIQLLFDPTVKPASRSALNYALNQYITQTKMEILMQRLAKMNGGTGNVPMDTKGMNVLPVTEVNLDQQSTISSASVNSVQHNVPAWTIFGIFLIVVPIAGNMIRERDEGSAVRVQLIPNAAFSAGLGKIVFYILVCLLQFYAMVLAGIYLMPLFDLPALRLGPQAAIIFPIAICIAFVAVAYGFFIGSIFKTANQAMPFGAITSVLMSAIGGIWVPVELLPNVMKKIALISPLHWSLEAVNQIILREQGFSGAFKPMVILLFLGTLLSILAFVFRRNK